VEEVEVYTRICSSKIVHMISAGKQRPPHTC